MEPAYAQIYRDLYERQFIKWEEDEPVPADVRQGPMI